MFERVRSFCASSRASRRLTILTLVALASISAVRSSTAQAVYGSISGVVLDGSGGVLPGATVTITSVDRKTADTVVTNESGFFLKERLLPGLYEVKAELQSFKSAVVPEVRVNIDAQTPINFKLEVGAIAETVTVTGGSPLLKTDRADVATSFDQRQLTDLPIVDRNFTKLILLTPGTQQLQWQHAASENPQGSTQTMVNGQHFSGTGYQLDGTENRDPILGIIVINPNLEAIGETKITSQNYDAEFGQATAGVVSVQTKSGTNEPHGSAYWFWNGDKFQARNPFSQALANPQTGRFIPETSQHSFGGTMGGRIVANRTFYFGAYGGQRNTQGGSRLLSVPTLAARSGDLSAYGVNIYDPQTGQQFPGNRIPSGRLSPQAQALLRLIPEPNAPGLDNGTRNNFVGSGSEKFDGDQVDVRIDHRLTSGANMFGRYTLGKYFRDGPTAFGAGGGPEFVSLGGVSDVRNQSLALGYDRSLAPTLLLDWRFGWFRYDVNVLPFDFGTRPAADAGVPGLNVDETFSSGLPALFIEGDRGFNAGSGLGVNRCNCPLDQDEQQWQIVSNLTKIWNDHTFKFGVDVRRAYNLRVPSDAHRSGELTFSPNRTSLEGSGGLGLATFLIGDVTRLRRYVSSSTDARERQWRHFYYAQDTWRPTSKLTVNYGLRLDVINPQTINAPSNAGFLDLDTGEILVVGVGGIPLNGGVENKLNWAPRLGVTYQIAERTVLRGGYGRTYDIGVFGSLFGHSVTQNLPVLSVQELNPPSNFDRVFTLASGPPPPQFPSVPSNGRFPLPNGVFARALPEQQRPPTVDAFNVAVQHQLTDRMSVDLAYVGNRGRDVFAGDGPAVGVNEPTLDGFLQGVSRDQRRPFFAGRRTAYLDLGGAFGWTQGIDYFCNCANNWYDALQAKLSRHFARGYAFSVNYTWQKAEGEGGGYFFWDRTVERGVQDWNRTHILNLTLVYELPFGRGKQYGADWSPAMDAALGGWQFNATHTMQSGVPFNVEYRGAGGDRDVGPNRPDLVGDPEGPQTRDQWFNTTPIGSQGSAFARPARGTFGNLERNHLRGPSYRRTDASLFKHIPLGEGRDIEVRIEAINLFNFVNLGQPDGTIGVPGDINTNAGRITSTAYGGADPQRNLRFAVKFAF
ncbi:MAG TPA: carboxypeptidase regulatory-like domain-containing protein [Vicinamibacterales bacterium]